MNFLLRTFFASFAVVLLIVAWMLDPTTAQLRDFLRLLHASLFWELVGVVAVVLLGIDLVFSGRAVALAAEAIRSNTSGKKLAEVHEIASKAGVGVYKRIDENRELLELLQREAPELLVKAPWIEGWLKSHDYFFTELARIVQVENRIGLLKDYPRPWPKRKDPATTATSS